MDSPEVMIPENEKPAHLGLRSNSMTWVGARSGRDHHVARERSVFQFHAYGGCRGQGCSIRLHCGPDRYLAHGTFIRVALAFVAERRCVVHTWMSPRDESWSRIFAGWILNGCYSWHKLSCRELAPFACTHRPLESGVSTPVIGPGLSGSVDDRHRRTLQLPRHHHES